MKILENIIPISYQNKLEKLFDKTDFPWFYNEKIAPSDEKYGDVNITDSPGYTHVIWNENELRSDCFYHVEPILYFLERETGKTVTDTIRIRARRTTQYPNHTLDKYNPPHVDLNIDDDYYSLVYYVDDSDGDTVIFEEKYDLDSKSNILYNGAKQKYRIPPKKGCAVLFDGKQYHSGNTPVNFTKRTIINFDIKLK